MKKATVAFSKNASNLFFHILTQCNLSCSHCYINPDQHGREMLDIETIRQWLEIFSDKAPQTNLVLLGGEPTLHPELDQVVRSARELDFKSITIDTNGYLFHDILNKIHADDIDFLSFSLDGATPATNDAIRGKGSYDTVLKGIKEARKKGFNCSMIYTVSDRNIHELSQMPDLVKTLDLQHFFIQVIGLRGNSSTHGASRAAKGKKAAQVNRDTWLSTIPEVAQKIADMGIRVTWPKVFLEPDETFQCAGTVADNYFIFPNGRVYRCPICEDFALHAFEIKENRLVPTPPINESDLFKLMIPEGCVMNRMIQPENLSYDSQGKAEYQIACCLLKEEITP